MRKSVSRFSVIVTALCITIAGNAQNLTSPYSILGIGDTETKDLGRYSATGSAAIGRRDNTAYNFSNPASLTALPLKVFHFEVAGSGRYNHFVMPGETTPAAGSKDFVIKRATVAFRMSQKSAFAFGLRPYSTANYKFNTTETIADGGASYTRFTEGQGGIHQVYGTYSRSFGKHISAGFTTSMLFGSLRKSMYYYNPGISLSIVKDEHKHYTAALAEAGIQYYTAPGKIWTHTVGLTASISTGLSGQLTTRYYEDDVTISKTVTDGLQFKLPVSIGFGYSAKKKSVTYSAEARYEKWNYQKVAYTNSGTIPVFRFSTGVEYSFMKNIWQGKTETAFIGMGLHAENSYLQINGNKLRDYSATFGGGLNPYNNISVYTGIEIGARGSRNAGQIRENYTRFLIGVTLKDIWIGTKKYGRFN